MKLHVVATGSAANTYILSDDSGESLILDAGASIKKVLPHVPDVRRISGCLITHEHHDHSKAWESYWQRGIPCIASKGTWEVLMAPVEPVQAMKRLKLGNYTVLPFDVQHDAREPFGFLIRHNLTGETALYVTDTYYVKYTFPGVNYWIVECNYCDDLIDAETDAVLRRRLKESHMSLRRLLDALKANDLTKLSKVVLVHLSDRRSDEKRMVKQVSELTEVETVAAAAGMTIDLSRTPF